MFFAAVGALQMRGNAMLHSKVRATEPRSRRRAELEVQEEYSFLSQQVMQLWKHLSTEAQLFIAHYTRISERFDRVPYASRR